MDISIENIKRRLMSVMSFVELDDRNIIESTDMFVPCLILLFYILNLHFLNKLKLTYLYLVITIGIVLNFSIINLLAKVIIYLTHRKQLLYILQFPFQFIAYCRFLYSPHSRQFLV
jgi:hypothetical protein